MTLAHGGVPPVSAGVAGCGVVGLAASAGAADSVAAAAAAASAAVGSSAPAVDGVGLAASAGAGDSVAVAAAATASGAVVVEAARLSQEVDAIRRERRREQYAAGDLGAVNAGRRKRRADLRVAELRDLSQLARKMATNMKQAQRERLRQMQLARSGIGDGGGDAGVGVGGSRADRVDRAAKAAKVAAASAALLSAARKGEGAVVEQLLAAGADVDATNCDGQTALHYAHSTGVVVEKLLAAGAAVNKPDKRGLDGVALRRRQGPERGG